MAGICNEIEAVNTAVIENPEQAVRGAERRYHRIIRALAGQVCRRGMCEIILLAGPSASGKTTTALKLAHMLGSMGHKAYTISLDDFFRDQRDCLDEGGEKDFESVHALDLPLLREAFRSLLEEGCCEVPVFDFSIGGRRAQTRHISINPGDFIIVEGLHALNPLITDCLPAGRAVKLYVNVSSRIYDAQGNVVLTKRNMRFVRRLIRDYHFRASTVDNTLMLWDGVVKGEDRYLFPFRDRADIRINSFHMYETCVFRDSALSLLSGVDADSPYYPAVSRLMQSLERFVSLPEDVVPAHSLLREFLG